jgi:hypothetical protein
MKWPVVVVEVLARRLGEECRRSQLHDDQDGWRSRLQSTQILVTRHRCASLPQHEYTHHGG